MPEIGKPRSLQAARFQNVQIAKNRVPTNEGEAKERERLLNKLTNYREKNDLYVDGKKHNKMGKRYQQQSCKIVLMVNYQ